MGIFWKIKKVLDRILETLVAVTMATLLVAVVWQVISRKVLNDPSHWTEELAIFLLIWVGLLGGSVALNRGAHLGIDYVVAKLSPRRRLYVEIFSFGIVALFSFFVMVVGGFTLVREILKLGQTSPALGWKMGHVYLALPISGFFLTLYSIEFLILRIIALVRGEMPVQE
ncbi:MAG: TRAP transporter small permease [Phycisphaerales bacterium]|nr:TRAP transporter small permease [Phycisphaerales bacterium]